jgi:hypothetical protein
MDTNINVVFRDIYAWVKCIIANSGGKIKLLKAGHKTNKQ